MKKVVKYLLIALVIFSCKNNNNVEVKNNAPIENDLVIAFGSCNRQTFENKLWKPVLENSPIAWVWGGDVIYSDTDDMELMSQHYQQQREQEGYSEIVNSMKILGTWDDHDYGLNDGGLEYVAKAESQQLFLDFMGVSKTDPRREREGVYHAEVIKTDRGSVKVIILDTRYFRSALTPSDNPEKRYQPNPYGEGTMLGDAQWQWLEQELKTSKADFNLIVSSIQFLSSEHGFETWGTMPHEFDRLKALISDSKAKGVIVLSGDRHISEFSKTAIGGVDYPLIDFTSSGMTHSYSSFDGEPNQYREGRVVSDLSFGLLKINFDTRKVIMQMRGENNVLQQELIQTY
ncbi:alkaline phosphatase D family protein [Pontimicrobium aquaticum]|uniref:Alkaline phosphatase family protein n=1 Tax=Pontimicrobium aquaticum TaxID=2565367 RepID=A0A4U0EWE4_9FLAO|nr:alkaline phosphatase D family protein [Pontimicrobium aquaticum]TJY36277.1 alkaline phosphatase family protein [Pontimicrobium aquaticum]